MKCIPIPLIIIMVGTVLLFLLFLPLTYAINNTIRLCGGDEQLAIYCMGDNQTVYSDYIGPSIPPSGGPPSGGLTIFFNETAPDKEVVMILGGRTFKLKLVYLVLLILLLIALLSFLIFIISRRKRDKKETFPEST